MQNRFIVYLVLFISVFIAGCNIEEQDVGINDFTISYLEAYENSYLVSNEVKISVSDKNAQEVLLNIRDLNQKDTIKTIEGKKEGDKWNFLYSNNNPFTKEIWLTLQYKDSQLESDRKIITNQVQDYEDAFENIVLLDEKNYKIIKQKVDLNIFGWTDQNKILARDNNDLYLYDIYKNEKEMIYQDVFNCYPSPSLNNIVYQNEYSIFLSDIKKLDHKRIFDLDETHFLKDVAWSYSEDMVLLHLVDGDKEVFYFVNLANNSVDEFSIKENEYILEDILFIDNNKLYAIGAILNNDSEVDSSKILLHIDRRTGKIKNYTPELQPMDEISILSPINSREFLVRISTSTISEDDLSTISNIYVLNTQKASLKIIKKDIETPYIYSLSPNKDFYIYLKKNTNEDKQDEHFMIIGEGKKKEEQILKTIQNYPSKFHWTMDGEKVLFYINSTKDIYLIERAS